MTSLQTLVDNTAPAGTLNLGGKRYDLDTSLRIRRAITIVGAGEIHVAPSTQRSWPTVLCQGADINLIGKVTVFGSKPPGHGYDPAREAQHGVELRSVTRFLCDGWRAENTYGDAFTLTRTATGPWCSDVTLRNVSSNEIGRQQASLDAVHRLRIIGFVWGIGYRSVFDIEPPGGNWGATDVDIRDGLVTSNPIGPLLASIGVGTSNSIGNINFTNIERRGGYIGVIVRPPAGVRRGRIALTDCWSNERAERTPFKFNQVDGPKLTRVKQSVLSGVAPVSAVDCTAVGLDDCDFSPTTTPARIVSSGG